MHCALCKTAQRAVISQCISEAHTSTCYSAEVAQRGISKTDLLESRKAVLITPKGFGLVGRQPDGSQFRLK